MNYKQQTLVDWVSAAKAAKSTARADLLDYEKSFTAP
jgi:hypothetical protein